MSLIFSPGYYTKIRLDDEGKIQDASQIDQTDLPKHSHSASDIDDVSLENKITQILSTFFVNNTNNAVNFTFDSNTKTISADINIDDVTISKNEYGELFVTNNRFAPGCNSQSSDSDLDIDWPYPNYSSNSDSSSSNDSNNTSTINIEDLLDKINTNLRTFRNKIPKIVKNSLADLFVNNIDSAVIFNWDDNTKTYSADLRYDEFTINKNEYGQLYAAFGGSYKPGSSSSQSSSSSENTYPNFPINVDKLNCANHSHKAAQIEDFEDAVKDIFDEYSKNLNIDLENLIDGVTIKINEYGQLVAVKTATEKHKHILADITDYNPPVPAVKQMMSELDDDASLEDGIVDFSKLNVGYSILALSKCLQDVVENIKDLSKKLDNVTKMLSSIQK